MYSLRALLLSFLGFAALDGAIFHSGLYARILDPGSSTGVFERNLALERERVLEGPNQVLAIGDSRMALVPRVANELTPETGYTFASVAVAGTSPRVWYYMLRAVDPSPGKYAAVIITLDDFNDDEGWEHLADRCYDFRFLYGRLGLMDLAEFAGSYDTWQYRWEAARMILFRGSAYAADFQDFLLHPAARREFVRIVWSKDWNYEYVAPSTTLEGVSVDLQKHTLTLPPNLVHLKEAFEGAYLKENPPTNGAQTKYMHHWIGKIYDRYRRSRTRLVFVRVPRGAFLRLDLPPTNPHSSARELAMQPGVTLIDEHMFDDLEKPELFQDQFHLNQAGLDSFSRKLGHEIRRILGPPR